MGQDHLSYFYLTEGKCHGRAEPDYDHRVDQRAGRHWPAGTRLIVEETPDGVLLKAMPVFAATSIEDVFGRLHSSKPALSVDDMHAVIAGEAKRRARD
jgi:hypothetical protein